MSPREKLLSVAVANPDSDSNVVLVERELKESEHLHRVFRDGVLVPDDFNLPIVERLDQGFNHLGVCDRFVRLRRLGCRKRKQVLTTNLVRSCVNHETLHDALTFKMHRLFWGCCFLFRYCGRRTGSMLLISPRTEVQGTYEGLHASVEVLEAGLEALAAVHALRGIG